MIITDWLKKLGFGALPDEDDTSDAPEPLAELAPFGADGLLRGARQAPIHPGRLGGVIAPWAAVVHCTDMHPSTFEALVRRWSTVRGPGSGAHFIVGRTAAEGVVQCAPLHRNANHAGGGVDPTTGKARPHGWFVQRTRLEEGRGRLVKHHPNRVSIGIEVHCAGRLTKVAGQWRTLDKGKPHGAPIPASDVDPVGATRGWHLPTEWQVNATWELLEALSAHLLPSVPPGDIEVVPAGAPPSWLWLLRREQPPRVGIPVAGHVDLDERKEDPGPTLLERLVAARGW